MKNYLRDSRHSEEILQPSSQIRLKRIQRYHEIDPKTFPAILHMNNDTLNYYDSLKRLRREVITQYKMGNKIPETISILIPSTEESTVTRLKKQLELPIIGLRSSTRSKKFSLRQFSTIKEAGASPNTLAFHARFQPILITNTILNFNLSYLDKEQTRVKKYIDSLFVGSQKRRFKTRFNKTDRTEACYQRFKKIGEKEYGIENFKNWLKRSSKREFNDQSDKRILVVISHQTLDRIISETVSNYKGMPKKRWNYQRILANYPNTVYDIECSVEKYVRLHPQHFDITGLKTEKLPWDIGDEKQAGTDVFELLLNNPENISQLKKVKCMIVDLLIANIPINRKISDLCFFTAPHLVEGFGGKKIKEFQKYMIDLYAVDQNNELKAIFELKGRTAQRNNAGLHDSFPEMMDLMYLSIKHPNILCAWVDIRITDDSVIYTIIPTKKKKFPLKIGEEQLTLINPMLYKVMRSPELQQLIGEEILTIWKTGLNELENPNGVLDQIDNKKLVNSKIISSSAIKEFTTDMKKVIIAVAKKYNFKPSIISVEDVLRIFEKQVNFLKSRKFPTNLQKWTPGKLWKNKMNLALQLDYYQQYQKYKNI
jgi:hypothetical protein